MTVNLHNAAISITPSQLSTLISKVDWTLKFFELRDDLLSEDQIREVVSWVPTRISKEKLLISFRNPTTIQATRKIVEFHALRYDWPCEWGKCEWGSPWIHSLHRKVTTLENALLEIEQAVAGSHASGIAKLAVQIENEQELEKGYQWATERPGSRVFLPSSPNGRWRESRLLMGPRMPFTFVREGEGTAPDQPSLSEWIKSYPQGFPLIPT